jgi:hypothetical protein
MAPYFVPPVAASAAIVPVFYGFVAKSALQLGEKSIPRMSIVESLTKGIKAAPTIGVIIGTQMIVQMLVENALLRANKKTDQKLPLSFSAMLVSSMIVGAISAPALAVFNGQTMGQTVMKSLKSLSVKQTGAILVRETSFLFSLRVSEPLSNAMKQHFGENKCVELGSAFVSGAIGSLIGHPADTALTLWQKGMKIEKPCHVMRGAPAKALAIGGFSVGYKLVNKLLLLHSE